MNISLQLSRKLADRRIRAPQDDRVTRWRRCPWPVLAFLLSTVLTGACRPGSDSARTSVKSPVAVDPGVGQQLPVVALTGLTPDTSSIDAQGLQGKITLLNLWGPWCGYCRMEMPELDVIQQRRARQADFQFISVACAEDLTTENAKELQQEVLEFLQTQGYAFRVYHDPQGKTRLAIAQTLGLLERGMPYPLTLLFGPDGRIRRTWMGYQPQYASEWEREIAALSGS